MTASTDLDIRDADRVRDPGALGDRGAPDERLPPGTLIARFIVHRALGAGGAGVVYAAHDHELDRTVALKILRRGVTESADARSRFLREAQALARLSHPNVISVYDVGTAAGRTFLAAEYIQGRTFGDWLSSSVRSWPEIVAVLIKAGRGLAAAHAAGLVHRDFKPANLLVGDDGRVVVTDFGLARSPARAVQPGADQAATDMQAVPAHSALAISITRTGAVQGTPAYMAPEQWAGEPADARADQFSFCVTLYEALFGVHPFPSRSSPEPASTAPGGRPRPSRPEAVSAALIPRPRDGRRVPVWLQRAVLRGLSLRTDDRYPSMEGLLAALNDEPLRRRRRARWAIAVGAGLIMGMVAAVLLVRSPDDRDQRCTGAAEAYASTWNAEHRTEIEAAFHASRAPYAGSALDQVTRALEQYAARWAQAHTATCRATRILGEQTEAMLDLRMACLERRRQEAAALVATLATADSAVVARSVEAALHLPDVATCADIAALRQVAGPPGDAGARVELAALTSRLAQAQAKLEIGSFAAGLALAREIVPKARGLGYLPFQAEAEFVQGLLESQTGDSARAEQALETAVWSAEAGRHDELAARAWTALVSVVGVERAEFARGLALVPRATAAIARLGGNIEIEAALESALGSIEASQSKLASAVPHFERALALAERAFGAGDPRIVKALDGLAFTVLKQGDADRAIALVQRALAIVERVLGPDHPAFARELIVLGDAHANSGEAALGEQELRRALAIREAALGPDHRDVVTTLGELAHALRAQGRSEEALALDRRQVARAERVFGPDHPTLGKLLAGFALSLGQTGHYAEAGDQLRRAEAIFTRLWGRDHDMVTFVHVIDCDLLIAQARWREAAALCARMIPRVERSQEAGDAREDTRVNVARAYIELHQPARALAALEPLAHRIDREPPSWRGAIRFMLARALWDSGRDRARARSLAALARPDLVSTGQSEDVAALDRWLASRQGA